MATIGEMVQQSIAVISNPSVATFEKYEKAGNAANAAVYVGIFAVVSGLFQIGNGIMPTIAGILATMVGFFVFSGLVYTVGKAMGGTGTFDEVAYTFSLFYGPLAVVFALAALILVITVIGCLFLPLLALAGIIVNIFFGYLAVKSSMNIPDTMKTWITLIVAAIGTFVVSLIFGMIGRIGSGPS